MTPLHSDQNVGIYRSGADRYMLLTFLEEFTPKGVRSQNPGASRRYVRQRLGHWVNMYRSKQ
ncbi:MAG: hypothetical protein JO170_19025 [Verrucomicrobia bacterium]|nr:hypothetical protein [Verrucomicrobiota bacterium]